MVDGELSNVQKPIQKTVLKDASFKSKSKTVSALSDLKVSVLRYKC